MTVNTTNITSGPYTGNGLSDEYEYDFKIELETQVSVYETTDLGVQTLLTLNVDYTVTGVGNNAGGKIIRTAGNLPTDYIWYIRSNYIENQLTSFKSQGGFFPDIHEKQFDHVTFLIQQLRDTFDRSFKLSDTIDIDGDFTLSEDATARLNKILGFDSAGDLTIVTLNEDFITVYLGSKTADPTTDNQGNPLIDGALYYNTTTNTIRVYDLGTTAWLTVNPSNQAEDIIVTDTNNHFTGVNVESILEETGYARWIRAEQIDTSLPITTVGYPTITALNGTDIAFIDETNDELRTYRTDGDNWSLIGSGLAITTVGFPSITALNGNTIAFVDSTNEEIRTYSFNGSVWSQVGSGLSVATFTVAAITALDSTHIAFFDATNKKLRTYEWGGVNWVQIGNEASIAGAGTPSMTTLNGTDIAFIDNTLDNLIYLRWDGTDWTQIGSTLSVGSSADYSVTALNGSEVVLCDTNLNIRIYHFNGSVWSQVSKTLVISGAASSSMAALNGTDVSFIDAANDELRTYRFTYYIGKGPHMLQ